MELPRAASPVERPSSSGSSSSDRWDFVQEYQMSMHAARSGMSYAEALCAGPFKAMGMGAASKQPGRLVSAALSQQPRRESQLTISAPRAAPSERWGEVAFPYM